MRALYRIRHLEVKAKYTRRVRTVATFDTLENLRRFISWRGRFGRFFIDRSDEPATLARIVAERA